MAGAVGPARLGRPLLRRRAVRALHAAHHRADGRRRARRRSRRAEIYDDWAEHQHFSLYDDVAGRRCARFRPSGLRLGLISNSHRCLASFQSHFELDGPDLGRVSSSDHGFMKPHPQHLSRRRCARCSVAAEEAVMVGDSLAHDVAGARAGRDAAGILLARRATRSSDADGSPVIRSLGELPTCWSSLMHAPAEIRDSRSSHAGRLPRRRRRAGSGLGPGRRNRAGVGAPRVGQTRRHPAWRVPTSAVALPQLVGFVWSMRRRARRRRRRTGRTCSACLPAFRRASAR